MKKIISKSMFSSVVAVLISSCAATYSGYMSDSAALSLANFSYVKKNIKGVSVSTYILGIGGLDKETLIDDAKQNMLSNEPLKSNQALANLTVNFKSAHYLGYFAKVVTCIITADVVEFTSVNAPHAPDENSASNNDAPKDEDETTSVGTAIVPILYQNVPIPSTGGNSINYYLPEGIIDAKMVFYNINGTLIKSVKLSQRGNGTLSISPDDNLVAGYYSYSLIVNEKLIGTRLMLLK